MIDDPETPDSPRPPECKHCGAPLLPTGACPRQASEPKGTTEAQRQSFKRMARERVSINNVVIPF